MSIASFSSKSASTAYPCVTASRKSLSGTEDIRPEFFSTSKASLRGWKKWIRP